MSFWSEFWNDESGLVMSAETVTLGTVGVLGSIVGLNAMGNAVNDELKEMASAIRSLDQSYGYLGRTGCRSWTAGSCYVQPRVEVALAEINGEGAVDMKAIQQKVLEERKTHAQPDVSAQPAAESPTTVEPRPNQIPKQEAPSATAPTPAGSK